MLARLNAYQLAYEFKCGRSMKWLAKRYCLDLLDVEDVIRRMMKDTENPQTVNYLAAGSPGNVI